jgi:hypothetical protein
MRTVPCGPIVHAAHAVPEYSSRASRENVLERGGLCFRGLCAGRHQRQQLSSGVRSRSRRRPSVGWLPPRSPWWLGRPWKIPPPHIPKGATSTGAIQRSTSIRTRRALRSDSTSTPICGLAPSAGTAQAAPLGRTCGRSAQSCATRSCSAHEQRRYARANHDPAVRHAHRLTPIPGRVPRCVAVVSPYSRRGRGVQARTCSGQWEATAALRGRTGSLRQRHAGQPRRRRC